MNLNRISIITFVVALLLAVVFPATAQQNLVTVTIEPDRTDWEWEPYAESISELFANSMESRVNEGLEVREFELDSVETVIRFAFGIGLDGALRDFSPLTPQNRYHAYLIQRTARKVAPFRRLPSSFPVFIFKGVITFRCNFKPTRWYKKLYFEFPLDTLELPPVEPLVRKPMLANHPLLPTYEPLIQDKNKLLTDFKKRIGVAEEITDTSSYSPLDISGRTFLVHLPYDSLDSESMAGLLLETRLETALEEAGAKIVNMDYNPQEVLSRITPAATTDDTSSSEDSMNVATDTSAMMDSLDTKPAPVIEPINRDLLAAFNSVFQSQFLVLSAGLAMDSTGDSAVCHLQIYPSENPRTLKRDLSYRFRYRGSLPDSLGINLVQRLTKPPAKPKPPPKPEPPAVDTTATSPAGADSASADSLAPPPAAPADTSATGSVLAPASTAVDTGTVSPIAIPADSAAIPDGAAVDTASTPVELAPSEGAENQPGSEADTASSGAEPPGQ